MIGVHRHDVVELGNGPVRADIALAAVVDRFFGAQPVKK